MHASPVSRSDSSSVAPVVQAARTDRRVSVTHVTLTFSCDFDAFEARFKAMLGRFDPADVALIPVSVDLALDQLAASQGEQGLMIFGSNDHGSLFPLAGLPVRKATRYYLGNPLVALRMTERCIGAALHAPLSVLIFGEPEGRTRVEYDLPSSIFARFGDPEIDEVGKLLDHKLSVVLAKAAG